MDVAGHPAPTYQLKQQGTSQPVEVFPRLQLQHVLQHITGQIAKQRHPKTLRFSSPQALRL